MSAVGRTATRNTELFIFAGSARLLIFLGGEKWIGWDFDGIFSDEVKVISAPSAHAVVVEECDDNGA